MSEEAISRIMSYHAHIYYRDPAERAKAAQIREQIASRFAVKMGSWRDHPVGPHAGPMYQVAFAPDVFAELVPWLMLNRQGLVILLHPNTGEPRRDHFVKPFWFGEVLPIMNAEGLPETSDADETVIPDARQDRPTTPDPA